VTKYKRVYRSVFRMSHLRSEVPAACRYDQRRSIGATPSPPSQPADSAAHSYPVDMASKGSGTRAADRDMPMRA
jgi:hypothetical protein